MNIQQNISLKDKNTFGINAIAKLYTEVNAVEDLQELCQAKYFTQNEYYILGGGSNTLFTDVYEGLVVRNLLRGIDSIAEDADSITFSVASGEDWDSFVKFSVEKGLSGIEALSLIPGSVGASPVQNIGAYGQEVKNTIVAVEAVNLESGKVVQFSNADCKFGYRDSVFKGVFANQFFITRVHFRLLKHFNAETVYEEVKKELGENYTVQDVRNAVISIRNRKLPNPKQIGNAGSTFKNPFISEEQQLTLKEKYPTMPAFKTEDGKYKIPAAWLIENAGWKGWTSENKKFGVYQNHALIVVNHGGAKAKEIAGLIQNIQENVYTKYGIQLEAEVNIVR